MDKKFTLPDFLKLLTSSNIPIAKAMAMASKVFKEYNTPALLAQLDDPRLHALGIQDKDLRKLLLAAVRRGGYAKPTRKLESGGDRPLASVSKPSTVQTPIRVTPRKKRKRDDDPDEFLPMTPYDEGYAYGNMDFNEVLDEEALRAKSTVVNRAPLMTVWAMIVAECLGFEREEALSIGSVYTEMNAISKGVSLGIIDQSKKREMEPISGGQPYVDLMGRRLLYQTQLSKWRALVSGSPALPNTAFSYITRAFRQTTPCIVGALRLLAESFPPQELNKVGFSLYADFRPTVDGWGKRGEVRCERILSLRKETEKVSETSASYFQHDSQESIGEQSEGSPWKRARVFSDKCEAALDVDSDEKKCPELLNSKYSIDYEGTVSSSGTLYLHLCNKKHGPMYR